MVGETRFELATSCSQGKNPTQIYDGHRLHSQSRLLALELKRWGRRELNPCQILRNAHFCGISLGLARKRSKSSSSLRQQTLLIVPSGAQHPTWLDDGPNFGVFTISCFLRGFL